MYRILIADDHPLFRQGIKNIMTQQLGVVTVGEAGTAHDLLELTRAQQWDAVVMDISMPGRSGPEVLRELKREHPALPVLVLSMHPEDQYAIRMFKAGANGYLTKSASPTELVEAIRKILAGGEYVPPTVAERLAFNAKHRGGILPHETLSDRELQVMCLLASAKTVTEVAQELSLSMATISTHRARILEKMSLKNNAELTRYALQHKLVE